MSLIQQALEKARRAPAISEGKPVMPSVVRPDPMGSDLENQLQRVQKEYAGRRIFYRKLIVGVLFLALLTSFLIFFNSSSGEKTKTPYRVSKQAPAKLFSGGMYRLTGITKIDGVWQAVINDEIVQTGDWLAKNAQVKTIQDHEVLLDVRGREIKLTFE